jgi:hypothetical protein
MRGKRTKTFAFMAFTFLAICGAQAFAQAALLMEEPYGFFGALNPTGHNAIYFARVCAQTPVQLRRCNPGELGVVIARYQGIDQFDWVAIPLVPYLYSVESATEIPGRVDRDAVTRMRERYRESHLLTLGENLPSGNLFRDGWAQLLGVAYERRTYAFRFETTPEQDDAFIARMNAGKNRSHFELLYNNCADFARAVLDTYFPGAFKRSFFPDAGMTTPKQITYKLVRHAKRHPDMRLTVIEIPQVPGYRRESHSNKSIAESLTTTVYAVPVVLLNPYLAGGLFVDYLVRGRHRLIPKDPQILKPDNLSMLTAPAFIPENPESEGAQAPSVALGGSAETQSPAATAKSGLLESESHP